MKYKTKVKYIDAVKYDGTNDDEVCRFVAGFGKFDSKKIGDNLIIAQEGEWVTLCPNEYIYKNKRGLFEKESANYFEAQWEDAQ